MNITDKEMFDLIEKYNDPKHCAFITQVPMSERNMAIIKRIAEKVCPIHRRWRGPKWYSGYNTKENAERVSVYPKDRSITVQIMNSGWSRYIKISKTETKYINER